MYTLSGSPAVLGRAGLGVFALGIVLGLALLVGLIGPSTPISG
jgi:hypothetical protein